MKLPSLPKFKAANTQPSQPVPPSAIEHLQKGMVSLTDLIAPASVEVDFRYIRVGERFYSTLFMVGYPRFVSPNWLQPIIDYDHTMDISMFCYPTASADVLADLRRKIGEMEATIASDEDQGHVVDPKVVAALEDAQALQEELAKGIERFFQFSFYITLSADDLNELQQATKQLQTTLASLLLTAKTATLQMEEGYKSTLPIAQDRLYITRNMDTTSLASTFPFTSAVLTQNTGIMYGVNQQNGSLIIFDRFSLENANEIVLGKSGSGKSYLIKLEIMRQFMLGTEIVVVDPEGEYEKLANTLGGVVIDFSSHSPIKINPFDLSQLYEEGENELGLKILSLHGLLKIILGNLDAEHDSILDKALIETYQQKGITPDPATQKKQAPLMEDLYKTLLGYENSQSREMALRLEKFIKGSASGIFNQPSNFDITSPLTVFSIRNLEEELRPIAMHIILDFVWTKVKKNLKKRLLVLDEAWYMMQYEDSASFVYSIAKRARKYYLGLTTATQDVEDFLSTEYGKAVLTNSSIQILLKQGASEVDLAQQIFYLSEGERQLLLSADIGEGLFFAGQNHVAMKVVGAPFEHDLITSNPADMLKAQQEAAQTQPTQGETPAVIEPSQPTGQPVTEQALESEQAPESAPPDLQPVSKQASQLEPTSEHSLKEAVSLPVHKLPTDIPLEAATPPVVPLEEKPAEPIHTFVKEKPGEDQEQPTNTAQPVEAPATEQLAPETVSPEVVAPELTEIPVPETPGKQQEAAMQQSPQPSEQPQSESAPTPEVTEQTVTPPAPVEEPPIYDFSQQPEASDAPHTSQASPDAPPAMQSQPTVQTPVTPPEPPVVPLPQETPPLTQLQPETTPQPVPAPESPVALSQSQPVQQAAPEQESAPLPPTPTPFTATHQQPQQPAAPTPPTPSTSPFVS